MVVFPFDEHHASTWQNHTMTQHQFTLQFQDILNLINHNIALWTLTPLFQICKALPQGLLDLNKWEWFTGWFWSSIVIQNSGAPQTSIGWFKLYTVQLPKRISTHNQPAVCLHIIWGYVNLQNVPKYDNPRWKQVFFWTAKNKEFKSFKSLCNLATRALHRCKAVRHLKHPQISANWGSGERSGESVTASSGVNRNKVVPWISSQKKPMRKFHAGTCGDGLNVVHGRMRNTRDI